MSDEGKEWHNVVVPPHAPQLVRHVVRILSIRISLYPLLKDAVHHALWLRNRGSFGEAAEFTTTPCWCLGMLCLSSPLPCYEPARAKEV